MKEQGLSVFGFVWAVLIILKAIGLCNWGWITILLFPIWFPILFVLAICGLCIACFLVFILFVAIGAALTR